MSKDSVIVFGGSGFLGSYVADALSDAGYKVRIFDRTPSTFLREDQEMIVGDIMDLAMVKKASKGCKYFYNFAGIADIGEAKDRPLDTANINIIGNVNLLEAARENQAHRFVFASTLYVFSEAGSFYRASKQASERFVEAYKERYGLNYTVLRYGSLYGRRASDWNGIYKLLSQALEKKAIVYNGSENSVREYIHVLDAAKLSVQILSEEYANRHIMITGPDSLSVKSLLAMISEMLPHEVSITFTNNASDEHYVMTPYAFNPKLGHKLYANENIDIGQGLLDCFSEIHDRLEKKR